MLNRNDIIAAVCSHLEKGGYEITQRIKSPQKGVDVLGKRSGTDETIRVKAQGGTSSRPGSARYGKPFDQSQAFDQVSKGYLSVCQLLCQSRTGSERVALAVPDEKLFRAYLQSIQPALRKLGISVLLVAENRSVQQI